MFSGNTCEKCAGVYKGIPMVYFGGCMYCTNNMFTVLFFNGLCTSNMFMVLQIVALWLYTSYKFCVLYLITKIYFIGGWAWVNQHSAHLHSVTLSKMLRLGWWLLYMAKHQLNCLHFSSVANIDLQVLLFNINIWVNFQLFIILWQRSNFLKRFSD